MNYDTSTGTRYLGRRKLLLIVVAGVIGEILLEFIAWVIAPPLLGSPMQPAILVADLARSLFGVGVPKSLAWTIHLASGVIVFPVGYLLFQAATGIRPLVAGLCWGFILWLVAQGILAPLAGRPFMLGFIPYTWGSLVAHVAYALAVALVFAQLCRRAAIS